LGSAEKAGFLPAFFLKAGSFKKYGEMSKETVDRVVAIADPILSHEGMEWVDIEFRRESSGWVLRLLIDKEGGVTLDDCTHISQELGRHLDVEDFISVPYTLEVSSPGLTRPLKKEKDFIKYRNSFIKVKTLHPIDNRRNFKGRLLEVSGGDIEIETEGRVFRIPLSHIIKANLEVDF
jgi:ribosome maturation factor RimP